MDDLNPNTRALLDAARSFDDPTDADRDRVRAGVMMRIGGVAAIGTAAITAAKSSSAAASAAPLIANAFTTTTVFSGMVAKVGIAMVLAGAVASGAYVALRPHHAPAPVVVVAAAPVAVAAPALAAPVAAADPEPAGVDPSELPLDDAKPSSMRSGHARSADLEGEMKLLRTADAALRRGDSASALAALNKHAALYPTGVLSQEREGVRAIALCTGGSLSQGQSAALRFLAQAAKSPLASRIRSACSLGE
jgi:hypothetical protein